MVFSRQLFWMAVCAGGLLLACREPAVCQIQFPASLPATRAQSDARPHAFSGEQFARGTWTLQVDGAFIHGFENPRFEQFAGGHVGVGYYFRDRLSINADVPIYRVKQDEPGIAGGFDLLARWHFFERDRLSLYLDGGAGFLIADRQVPRGGTHFNFTPQIGIGATWLLDDHAYLYGGARIWHLSNAGMWGHERNPSIDKSLMGYIGIGWRF
jgi:hypothetical protein